MRGEMKVVMKFKADKDRPVRTLSRVNRDDDTQRKNILRDSDPYSDVGGDVRNVFALTTICNDNKTF